MKIESICLHLNKIVKRLKQIFQTKEIEFYEELYQGSNIGANWWNSDMMDQNRLFTFPEQKLNALSLDLKNVLKVSQEETVQLYQAGGRCGGGGRI